jgi:hypothetical protein
VTATDLPGIPTEALNEASRALGDEYEQPADWHRADAQRALEAALPSLWQAWIDAASERVDT